METVELAIQVKGEVVSSNLDAFRDSFRAALAQVNKNPQTDEEFGKAQEEVKAIAEIEKAIKLARDEALKEATELNDVLSALEGISEEGRQVRLALDKQVKEAKARIKEEIIDQAVSDFAKEANVSPDRLGSLRTAITERIKGKRTRDTILSAANVITSIRLANIEKCREILGEWVSGGEGREALILDRLDLEMGDPKHLPRELESRLERQRLQHEGDQQKKKAQEAQAEAERVRAEAEEANKPPLPPAPTAAPPDPAYPETDEAEEWRYFAEVLFGAFGNVKAARAALQHPANQDKARRLAEGVNALWIEINEPEEQAA